MFKNDWEQITFLTRAAYCDLPFPSEYNSTKINTFCGLNAIFIECEEYDLLIFRGTSSIRDWITDIEMVFRVPTQFKQALEFAKKNINPEKKLIITGHSLGGAIVQYVCNEIEATNFVGITYNPAGIAHLVEPKFDYLIYNFILDKDILNAFIRSLPWNFFKNLGEEFYLEDKISKNGIESHSNFRVFIDHKRI